jgi:hypothetical protein
VKTLPKEKKEKEKVFDIFGIGESKECIFVVI